MGSILLEHRTNKIVQRRESKTNPTRLARLDLVEEDQDEHAINEEIGIVIGIYFTHLVAKAEEGRKISSKEDLISLTRNIPSPFTSQLHLSLAEERILIKNQKINSPHC
ncbi:hypothetical protein Tco_0153316 [Tanacetum coccineum]